MLAEMIAPCELNSLAVRYAMLAMLTIEDIRHARLLQLLQDPRFPTIQRLADAIDKSHAQVSQWKNRSERRNREGAVTGVSNIDSNSARLIEERCGMPRGWMDHDPAYDSLRYGHQAPAEALEVEDLALLEDVKLVLGERELGDIHARASLIRKQVEHLVRQRLRDAGSTPKVVEENSTKERTETSLYADPPGLPEESLGGRSHWGHLDESLTRPAPAPNPRRLKRI
jgi:hypothetical protein